MSAVDDLFAQATTQAQPQSQSPMAMLQLLTQLGVLGQSGSAPVPPGSGGSLAGLSGAPIQGPGAALKLAVEAAQRAGVPVSWAHDPKFWYQTEHESGLYPSGTWADIVRAAHADNPTSSAYGIGQFLDATRQTYGLPLNASPLAQLTAMFKYIHDRYGTPLGAFQHRMQVGWY